MATETNTFWSDLQDLEETIAKSQRFELEASSPEEGEVSFAHAVKHAAGLRIMQNRLEEGNVLHLMALRDDEYQNFCVYFNSKSIMEADDNLCIWRSTNSATNCAECARSIMKAMASMLTVIGYEVYVNEGETVVLFNPLLKGRVDDN
tara:strand:+ start:111615 stop:112058 length:444 start_codon:yes stop_codon:yes gene_type:complete